jgi:hypothetical protein
VQLILEHFNWNVALFGMLTTMSIKGGEKYAEVYDNLAPQPERAVAD